MQNINWPLTLTNTFAANAGLITFLWLVWFVGLVFSAWTCLNKLTGIDRLTWLAAIVWLPVAGIIFFWLKGVDENARAKAYKGVDAV